MSSQETARGSKTQRLSISSSLGPSLEAAQVPPHSTICEVAYVVAGTRWTTTLLLLLALMGTRTAEPNANRFQRPF
jgi:hypothetical protein